MSALVVKVERHFATTTVPQVMLRTDSGFRTGDWLTYEPEENDIILTTHNAHQHWDALCEAADFVEADGRGRVTMMDWRHRGQFGVLVRAADHRAAVLFRLRLD